MISKSGFVNPQTRGQGADGGRDIEAEFVYKVGFKDELREKCWFQCKKQKQGVSYAQISTEIQKAENDRISKFFILSNSDTTPDCKDDYQKWNQNHRCLVLDWTGTKFLDLLFQYPNVCKYYFPDEELPPIVSAETPKDVISKSSELGNRYGINLEFKIDKQVDLTNSSEVAEILKDGLSKLTGIDLNLRALIYQQISMFFFSIEKSEDAIMFLNKSLEITPKNVDALLNKGFISRTNG